MSDEPRPSPTGIAATSARLWAVALLTFKEAIRRKVFIIVLIFAAALIASVPFLPSLAPDARLRLIEIWSVRAAFVFSIILAIFLAGFSITGDVEQRRIYTLVTKPIHKVTLLLGKFLGFTMMIGAFLASTGLISVVYLRAAAAFSRDFPRPTLRERHQPATISAPGGEVNATANLVRIVGGKGGRIHWTFEGLRRGDFDPEIPLCLKVDLGREGSYELEGTLALKVGAAAPRPLAVQVRTNEVTSLTIPRDAIGEDGRLVLEVGADDPGLIIIARTDAWAYASPTDPRALSLLGRTASFEWNYFKGLLLVLFQSSVVLAMTLAASTILSAPVSIMLGVFVFMIGWSWSFLSESIQDVDVEIANYRAQAGDDHGHRHPSSLVAPPWVMQVSAQVSRGVLKLIPNFGLFNMSDYLMSDLAITGRDVGGALLAMLPRVLSILLVGVIAIWRRDFAT